MPYILFCFHITQIKMYANKSGYPHEVCILD